MRPDTPSASVAAEPPLDRSLATRSGLAAWIVVGCALLAGLALMADSIRHSSATYDEVAYLRIAARWWQSGDQEQISRMGSPLTFWKLQQGPVFWVLDRLGFDPLLTDPIGHQAVLLPLIRFGSLWIWGLGLVLTALWARSRHGPAAMALAAVLFALEPNLLAHGALITMEAPLVACTAGVCLLFDRFVRDGARWAGLGAAALCGLAFSCKFTAVLLPPLLALGWLDALRRRGESWPRALGRVVRGMAGFVAILLMTDLLVTGFATLTPSESRGEHPALAGRWPAPIGRLALQVAETPLPQDWVAFAIQSRHQRSGGPSYLLGAVRQHGWWYYYLVALAVKLPLAFALLIAARLIAARSIPRVAVTERLPILFVLGFLAVTALGSSRNYGVRYLLPIAPAGLVWLSGLALASRRAQAVTVVGLVGLILATAAAHPYELTFFNSLAGGTLGGRHVLADSNLDWGQGLRVLARLQDRQPELRDLTVYYFGDTEPSHYGVNGVPYVIDAGTEHPGLPARFTARTAFVAVSASLQYGPWGPPGYFAALQGHAPVVLTDDGTIAVYRTADVLPGPPGAGMAGGPAGAVR